MHIHEYQAKALLKSYGVPVPDGCVAHSPLQAEAAAARLPGPVFVVKSQIHAGARGRGHFRNDLEGKGGIRIVRSHEKVRHAAEAMLGQTLVTEQTGPGGQEVRSIYVEQGCVIARELYLCILVDRLTARVTVLASATGGMDIEETATWAPGRILRVPIDPATGLSGHHGRRLAYALGLEGGQVQAFMACLSGIYRAFMELDCELIEINPLIVTGSGDLMALDAAISFDESALFRHPEVARLRDEAAETPQQVAAARHNLHYVGLDGTIGCMVNGAGLAMATMDIIRLYGESPANFLDIGGGTSKERVAAAFKIILSDPKVEGILINIFGGIMRCDLIAEGVVAAAREVSLKVPLVVRLQGTNFDLGERIIAGSGLEIVSARSLADAAVKIVLAVQDAREAVAA